MRKLTVIAVVAVAMVAFAGCEKETPTYEPPKRDCEINKYGWLIIKNENSVNLTIYVNNKNYGAIVGYGTREITVDAGFNDLRVTNGTNEYIDRVYVQICETEIRRLVK